MLPDGHFLQAEVTSCGLNGGPLKGRGEYEARIAAYLSSTGGCSDYGWGMIDSMPYFTQMGEDGVETGVQYIAYMGDGAWTAFKYFSFDGGEKMSVSVRGDGEGYMEVATERGGEVLLTIPVSPSEEFKEFAAEGELGAGVHPLYLTYRGEGHIDFISFKLY